MGLETTAPKGAKNAERHTLHERDAPHWRDPSRTRIPRVDPHEIIVARRNALVAFCVSHLPNF